MAGRLVPKSAILQLLRPYCWGKGQAWLHFWRACGWWFYAALLWEDLLSQGRKAAVRALVERSARIKEIINIKGVREYE